jgi:hypothetical protein
MAMSARTVYEDFTSQPSRDWKRYVVGDGALEATGTTLLFVNTDTSSRSYTDAQIDDYQGLPRRRFLWRPPLKLTVRARFSHGAGELSGTAGFGFWNDPFMMTGRRLPTLPQVLWFFYASQPSDMKLDLHTPGHGWKAATLDAKRLPFFVLLPLAPLAIPLMKIGRVYRAVWPVGQRSMGVTERALEVSMTQWHTYTIEWRSDGARFSVDGDSVLEVGSAPNGPLGFVMWLDNQYAVVKPWGKFGYGLLDAPGRQSMEVDVLVIEPA